MKPRMRVRTPFSRGSNQSSQGNCSGGHCAIRRHFAFTSWRLRHLGTRILKHASAHADAVYLPVRLEYLKWNPVGRLYLRNGLRPTHETEIHVFLELPPVPMWIRSAALIP